MGSQVTDLGDGRWSSPLRSAKKFDVSVQPPTSLQGFICTAYALCLPTLRGSQTEVLDVFSTTAKDQDGVRKTSFDTALLQQATVEDALLIFCRTYDDVNSHSSKTFEEQSSQDQRHAAILFPGAPLPCLDNTQRNRYDITLNLQYVEGSQADMVAVATVSNLQTETAQVARLLDRIDHVLAQIIVAEPSTRLDSLDLCSPAELQEIKRWNSVELPEAHVCVHDLFAEQVPRCLDQQAIEAWDFSFTYRELDVLASRLTSKLVDLGVGPESMVPFCFEKSGLTPIVLLAVLRAGGACIPLDPAAPSSRLAQIVEQTGAKLALTSTANSEHLSGIIPATLTISYAMLQSLECQRSLSAPTALLDQRVTPENTAFVLFTSGSTGQPKGIALTHRALATSMRAHAQAWDIGPTTRTFSFSAYTFDASIADIFTTVGHGGCVCVPSDEARLNRLAESIRDMSANWCFLTPTVASTLQPSDVP